MNSLYRLQFKPPGQPWQDHTSAPAVTESEAWEKLAAWERYCPTDRWRWVRAVD